MRREYLAEAQSGLRIQFIELFDISGFPGGACRRYLPLGPLAPERYQYRQSVSLVHIPRVDQ
jgi:hypothetical protein